MLGVVYENSIDLNLILVLIHVVSAITLLGPSTAFGILGKRAADPATGGHKMLEALLDIEHKMVLPGSAIQFITGVWLIVRLDLDKDLFANGWLWTSILAFALILVLSIGFDTPAVRRIVAAGNAGRAPDEKDLKLAKTLGPVFGILFMFIIVMMVLKPF
jgi:uncharacterized membrane protein